MPKDWSKFEIRGKVKIFPCYEIIEEGTNTTNRKQKYLYDFCICDACLGKVFLKEYGKEYKKNGAIINLKNPSGRSFELALHSKCLKQAMKDFNEYYNERKK